MNRFLKNSFSALLLVIAGIFLFILPSAYSQDKATIFPESNNFYGDTVDMGMSFSRTPMETYFNLKNLSTNLLSISNITGGNSWGINGIKGHVQEYDLFVPPDASLFPIDVLPSTQKRITIKFVDTLNISDITGSISIDNKTPHKKAVRLRMGLFDRTKYTGYDPKDYAIIKDYILIARNTYKNIDVFETIIDYDSVFVNPVDTIHKFLTVQNSSKDTLSIESIRFSRPFISFITTDNYSMPIKLNPYLTNDFQKLWDFRYFPLRQGFDYDSVFIKFKPDPKNHPDSTDSVSTVLIGVGVTQNLDIKKIIDIKKMDTAIVNTHFIDFGDVNVGDTVEKQMVVELSGNLPFGPLSQKIKDIDSDIPALDFELTRKMNDTFNLQPSLTDTFNIKFTPSRSDTFHARLVIASDIVNRRVWGYPDSSKNVIFYINGIGRQAEIATLPDTIDFGNVVLNKGAECPGRSDTTIVLSNIGNLLLKIKDIRTETKYSPNPFVVNINNLEIPGKSSKDTLKISFDATGTSPGIFFGNLIISSNSAKGKDTVIIVLKARGILPDIMNISMPKDIVAMPGRRISIPILIDSNKISVAKEYTDTLIFNNTLLSYIKSENSNTASKFADLITIKQDSSTGKLFINIKFSLATARFEPLDTLINLMFDTFLGNEISTTIHFYNPSFGDGICSRVLSTNSSDCKFTLDSVCGLQFKTSPVGNHVFQLNMPSPNPSSNIINIGFEMAFKTKAEIYIYNSYGELVKTIVNQELPEGIYSSAININDLSPGVYFLSMQAGIFKDARNLVITK